MGRIDAEVKVLDGLAHDLHGDAAHRNYVPVSIDYIGTILSPNVRCAITNLDTDQGTF